jgi:diguanylate cyclase (GGDEF)-like protein
MGVVAFTTTQLGHDQRAREIEDLLKAQSLRTLEMFSAGALESVIQEDIAVVDVLIRDTAKLDPDLYSVRVSNAAGGLIVYWVRPGESFPDGAYTFEGVVEHDGLVFGNVTAVWNPARLIDAVNARLALEQSRMIVALLTLTALSLFLLHILVTSPLSRIGGRLRLLSDENSRINDLAPLNLSGSREMQLLSAAVDNLGNAIDASRTLAAKLEYQAGHDYLTGLVSRSSFEQSLRNHLASRTIDSPPATLLFFDLDQFKLVNDSCGHAAGDALLVQLSAMLRNEVQAGDVFARLGGDEFALLLPTTDLPAGESYAEHLRLVIERFRFSWQERTFAAEASIGVVAISGADNDMAVVLQAADTACYAAKYAGRNRIHVYQEDDERRLAREREISWVPRIRAAIEASRFVLYGQLIEPAKSGACEQAHLEILVRMLDEHNELIPPGAFLPSAERYGLMPQIDSWVISHTLEWMSSLQARSEMVPVCAINISGASVCDARFREFLLAALADCSVPCSSICFEITETAAVADLASAIRFMEEVRQMGCRFALDDFGAGMSSFTYLKNLPVDFIKIDGAFVKDLLKDDTSLAMVRAIADISRVMNIASIAEFVENDAIRQKLAEIGIDYVQGYGVGKPQPVSLFETGAALQRVA